MVRLDRKWGCEVSGGRVGAGKGAPDPGGCEGLGRWGQAVRRGNPAVSLDLPVRGRACLLRRARGCTVPPAQEQSSHLGAGHTDVLGMSYRCSKTEISSIRSSKWSQFPGASATPSPSCSLWLKAAPHFTSVGRAMPCHRFSHVPCCDKVWEALSQTGAHAASESFQELRT